jgi:protein-tyrosine sulfotransferase
MFPNAKFIYMVRDGRSVVYSLIKIYKESNDPTTIRKYLLTWNSFNKVVNYQCKKLGSKLCKLVKYEDLILKTKDTMKEVGSFLNLSWTNEFLNHEKYIGDKITISSTEWSTNQIKEKIYTKSLRRWMGNLNYERVNNDDRFPIFREFGYD